MCIYCGNIYKSHHSQLSNASEVLESKVLGTYQDLATYLTTGFWDDFETETRKFNLTNTGAFAKNGVLTYNTTGNSFDSDGISSERSFLVDESFKLLENILGIDFQKTSNLGADIRFSDSNSGAYASSSYSAGNIIYSNINISESWHGFRNGFGNYTFQTVLHEIGHALGLGHQGNYNSSGSYTNNAIYTNDSWQSSIMSYFSQSENTSINASFAFLSTFSVVDLIALDDLYNLQGFSLSNSFIGDTTYGFNTNISFSTSQIFSEMSTWIETTAFTIADGNGIDTLDFSGFSDNQVIDLRSTEKNSSTLYSSDIAGLQGNLVISPGTIIENAIGGLGNDNITGNSSNNTLNGGKGDDILIGGFGDDTFVVDSISDTVNENINEGIDLILTSVSYTLPNNVEKITLTGSSDLDVIGNNLNNTFRSNSGNNYIDGALGTDIVIFDSFFNNYSLSLSDGNIVIEDDRIGSPNGETTLKNIEIIEFSDLTKITTELLNSLHTINQSNYGAADLNSLDTNTTGTIDASSIKALSGTTYEINSVYTSSGISGLGNETITITDASITVAQANVLSAFTTGIVTANISDGDMETLDGLTETGNAYTVTVIDASVAASALNTLNAKTTGVVTVQATTITGTAADINAAYTSNTAGTINGLGNEDLMVNNSSIEASLLNSLDTNTTGTIDASSIKALSGTTYEINSVYTSPGISGLGNEDLIVNNSSIEASLLNSLDTNTTGTIDASSITALSGTAYEINSVYTSSGISGLGNENLIVNNSSIEASLLNSLDTNTTGTIDASSITALSGTTYEINSVYTSSGISGLGNEDLIVNNSSIEASLLNSLDINTTGFINAAAVTTIIGTYTEINIIYSAGANGSITGLSNEAIAIADAVTVTQANAVNALTTEVVTANISDGDMETLDGLTETGNAYTVTVIDASVAASALNTLNAKTTGVVTVQATTITGTAADINTAYTSNTAGTINGLGNEDLMVNNSSIEASLLNSLDTNTTGTIDASSITALSGTAYEINSVYTSSGISGLGNETITITDASITVAQANVLSAFTTGIVTANISDGDTATLDGLIETGNAYTVTVTDASVAASALNTLNAKTTGIVTVQATTITGTAADINAAYTSNTAGTINGLGNEDLMVNNSSIEASLLNSLDTNTTGTIDASSIKALSGTTYEINSVYTSSGISGLGNETITITDASITVAQANVLSAFTTGIVTANISDGDMETLDGLTETGNAYTVTVIDASVAASALNTLNAKTTGVVTVQATTITGTAADINTAYTSNTAGTINGLGNEDLMVNNSSIEASLLNSLDTNTTGTIDASTITTITGTGSAAQTAFDSAGITGLTFDAANYLASHADLMTAFGSSTTLARSHYFSNGVSEGRSFDSFDEKSYLAGYADLLGAFGTNTDSALVHYINNGYKEGRSADAFDENSYLASNTSLIGLSADAAVAHYLNTGYAAGLATDSFDENSYLASNTSLIGLSADAATAHYVNTGYAAGLAADSFDELGYIASHSDLISAFGTNGVVATQHYISYGFNEGRTVTFDAAAYLGANADLRAAFGTDQELATKHYITNGVNEGRVIS